MSSNLEEITSDDVEVRLLSTPEELDEASEVLMQVWGSNTPIVTHEMLRAVHHSGGYISGAYEQGRLVGHPLAGWRDTMTRRHYIATSQACYRELGMLDLGAG